MLVEPDRSVVHAEISRVESEFGVKISVGVVLRLALFGKLFSLRDNKEREEKLLNCTTARAGKRNNRYRH